MNRIAEKKFIELMKYKGIMVDSRYPDSAELCFENDSEISRFWVVPKEAKKILYFVSIILTAIDSWGSIFVWKHLGSWTLKIKGERLNDDIQALIYRGIGISDNNADILEFRNSELPELATLIFNQLAFGWHVGDDLYIIPDHGKQMIKTDHHDVVHVSFRDEPSMTKFVEKMNKNGFVLPDDVPDETFKRPEWMR